MTEVGALTATTGIGQASCCGAGAAWIGAGGIGAVGIDAVGIGAVGIGAVFLTEGGRCKFCKAGDAAGVDPL